MIFFLYGDDTFRSRRKLKEIVERFKKTDKSRVNLIIFDGEKITFRNLEKEIVASPFLHDKKLIVVEKFLKHKGQKQEELANFLKTGQIPKSTIIIFWEEGEPGKETAIFKLLNKPKQAEKFDLLKPPALVRWVEKEIKEQGGKIEKPAIQLLADLVGSDLWQMSNEIGKLIAYCQSKPIAVSDINILVRGNYEEKIFDLTDALAAKNKKKVFKILDEQLLAGLEPEKIFLMLVWLFRILLQVKEVVEQDYSFLSPRDQSIRYKIAGQLGINPFVAGKAISQIKNYSLEELKKIYKRLLSIDMTRKTSKTDPRVLLDLLMAEICL